MSNWNNNPPAFPLPAFRDKTEFRATDDLTHDRQHGMMLRDYFAAQVLPVFAGAVVYSTECDLTPQDCAELAYRYADAMLAARSAHHQPADQ